MSSSVWFISPYIVCLRSICGVSKWKDFIHFYGEILSHFIHTQNLSYLSVYSSVDISPTVVFSSFCDNIHSNKWYLIAVLISIFLMNSYIEDLFMLSGYLYVLFRKMSMQSFWSFFSQVFWLLQCNCMSSLFCILASYRFMIWFTNFFFPNSVGYLSILLMVFSAVQKFSNVI